MLSASTVQEQVIGFFAVLLGAGNAADGYAVTDRMLAMFQPSARAAGHAKGTGLRPSSGCTQRRSDTDASLLASLPSLGIGLADLAAAFLFLYGLHRMSLPVTAPSGIFVAGIGMAVAVPASFLYAFDVGSAARPGLPVKFRRRSQAEAEQDQRRVEADAGR